MEGRYHPCPQANLHFNSTQGMQGTSQTPPVICGERTTETPSEPFPWPPVSSHPSTPL